MVDSAKIAVALFGLTALAPGDFILERVAPLSQGQTLASRFAQKRNSDLKKEGIRMATRLRDFAASARLREIESLSARGMFGLDRAAFAKAYAGVYRAEAVQLRDEILARLPRSKRPVSPYVALDFATSPDMLEEGAGVLEKLARILPEMPYREPEHALPHAPPNRLTLQVV